MAMPLGIANNEPDNPYQPLPESSIPPENGGDMDGISETARGYLQEAVPWLRFIGIVGFVGCGITALIGLIMLIATPMIPKTLTNGVFNTLGPLSGLLQMGGAVIGFLVMRFVYSFGTRLRNYLKTNSITELELAFKNNKSLWKFYGILTIVGLAIIPITIVITLIVTLGTSLF
jgi:hypothetical protein